MAHEQSPGTGQDLNAKARALIDEDRADEALAVLATISSPVRSVEAQYLSGLAYRIKGEQNLAIKAFLAAFDIDQKYDPALAELADIAYRASDGRSAMTYINAAMSLKPGNLAYKNAFVNYFSSASIYMFSAELKNLIRTCLETDGIAYGQLLAPWLTLLRADPDFEPFLKLLRHKKYKGFRKDFLKTRNFRILQDPYFLLGLENLVIADRDFEGMLAHMRRLLLDSLDAKEQKLVFLRDGKFDRLRCAMANYCFMTEYIFPFAGDEVARVALLRTGVASLGAEQVAAQRHEVMALAMYEPLFHLKNPALSPALHAVSPDAGMVARVQIDEPLEEFGIRDGIEAITKIEDETSLEVRGQYETFPYPRWKSIDTTQNYRKVIGAFKDDGAQMLVMGTGTGLEAAGLAIAFPKAQILAIDLSRASLSYGARKAREMGLNNITFRQADILELRSLGRTFDMIVSWGVLHHLRDPGAGFAVLSDLLKPGGLARIALYSEAARRPFVPVMKLAREKYGTDAAGIRQFRQDVPKKISGKIVDQLYKIRDYYITSEVRDFLFHVMEHRVDVPQIEAYLKASNLEFMKFLLAPKKHELYREAFPDDPKGLNLDHWAEFEKKNPALFLETYAFWCRKKI